ncbi:MAG: hypothetical protein WD847_16570 [Pirellulales bacterium]
MKFSLLTLLGAVAVAAVGCAALSHPVQGSAMAVFTAAILLLFGAVLAAICCGAAARLFWLGFAILGWGYLLLVWVCLENELEPNTDGRILATTWGLDELAEATLEPWNLEEGGRVYIHRKVIAAWRCLLQIGHTLWALVFAFVGGVLARWLYVRRERHS